MILSFLRDEDNERMSRCQGKRQQKRGDIHIVKGRGVCYEKISGMVAMDKKERETLGAYLRREREAREIKLTAVSKATRISMPLLVALEADDHDAFPDKKAIPDCLKSYCRYLLIDEQEALRCFELHPARHCLPEDMEETRLIEVVDDLMPLPVHAPSYVLPPVDISPEKKPGILRKHRPIFVNIAALALLFAMLAGTIFYFQPFRESAAKKDIIKVEVPQIEVPQGAVKSLSPAVRKESVIENREMEMKALGGIGQVAAIKSIGYEKGVDGQDEVMVVLDRMVTPEIPNLGGGKPRIVMDFLHAQYGKGLPLHIDTKGLYVQRIRVGRYLSPVIKTRIVLDLVPGQKYSTDQAFDGKKNVYTVTVKSLSPAVRKEKVIGNRNNKRYHLPGMKY